MGLSLQDMHARYRQQAGWTAALRRHLFTRLGLNEDSRILEVGCGTGAVLESLDSPAIPFGLDINLPSLSFARHQIPAARLAAGDAHRLPYHAESFDLVYTHFVLLWLADSLAALKEMCRVTRPGGAVLALAEPDYGSRIDFPPALEPLGRLQAEALHAQGAYPDLGRRLPALFQQAGLSEIESGVLGAEWPARPSSKAIGLEQRVLRADLASRLPPAELEALLAEDQAAWAAGQRVLYVPTFYALGHRAA